MEHNDCNTMTPFDQLISTQNLQMLKLLIPYTPPGNQRFLAVYVKFLELQNTIHFFRNFKNDVHMQDFQKKSFSPFEMIQEILPYMPSQTAETMDTIMNMMNMMELFQTFSEMPGTNDDANSGFDPMEMMKTMFPPEQQSMFEMYNTMFQQGQETESNENNENIERNESEDSYD